LSLGLQQQPFEHPTNQIVLQGYLEAVRRAEERLVRIEHAIAEFLPSWLRTALTHAPPA
jgi:hypothetical protein